MVQKKKVYGLGADTFYLARLGIAISERNALWAILVVLTAGIGYQIAAGIVVNEITRVDPVILLALIVGTIVKAASNFYLDKKN